MFMIHQQRAIVQRWEPIDTIAGFKVRPGLFHRVGANYMSGGVSFTVYSVNATGCTLCLFKHRSDKPFARLKYPDNYRIGKVFSMFVFDLDIEDIEYAYCFDGPYDPEKGLLFDNEQYILDPYAHAVAGQSVWGAKFSDAKFFKARVVHNDFDWGAEASPSIKMQDLIIYELHVRNFTIDPSSGVENPGTFDGIREKIPYLKDLGINCVELMPVFEFNEMHNMREVDGKKLLECWGYNTTCFFAPNTVYAHSDEYNHEGNELKRLIKELHDNGIEVILDVVFNHTGEGNENGPFFSFKGLDNNIYYMLTPDGRYYNFSGCGNTLNCNHPIVQHLVRECLRHWTINYRVDGFRFDLAAILGRNEDGTPMSRPPLIQSLAFDPVLGDMKLIAEAWDAGGLYQVGKFPSWNRFSEWNGMYRDDMRRFLRGDDNMAGLAAIRLTGSQDLYPDDIGSRNASVNFLSCHDGFTLYDLYSYNKKHNEANGWDNTDGANDNYSWNCGAEGKSDDPEIRKLRHRMVMNAIVALMMSRGTPMFYAGDEFGNSQFGNNNAYCQDNEVSWLNWNDLSNNRDIYEMFRFMIAFRNKHAVIRRNQSKSSYNIPKVSTHGYTAWMDEYSWESKQVGVMYAGKVNGRDDIVYACFNSYWEPIEITVPDIPGRDKWDLVVDTYAYPVIKRHRLTSRKYTMGPRSAIVLEFKS
ncbi:MAG: glycogen debranching enzyme [Lachnospiraceae bacterium]|nr:glycogen debranching enzyme [Lachnospiraceae bacterium]